MTVGEIYTFILSQADEGDLDRFSQAIKNRREMLANRQSWNWYPGTRVVTTGKLSPKYMLGLKGTITKINRKTAVVNLDNMVTQGRFYGCKTLTIPLSCLKEI